MIEELKAKHGRHRVTMKRLALVDAESASTKAEAESAKGAMSLAIKNFKDLEEFKEEIHEGRFASYCVGYEDSRDAVEKLYPHLNWSSIIPPSSGEEAIEEGAVLVEGDAPAAPGPTPTSEVVPEQEDEETDWLSMYHFFILCNKIVQFCNWILDPIL